MAGPAETGDIVIVGGGQAGFQLALSLRQEKYEGGITIVDEDEPLPYQRPPLSKAYMLGDMPAALLPFRPAKFYADQRISIVHDRADAIDRHNRRLLLANGAALPYGVLVLATGARRRTLPVEGATLPAVFGLSTRADADALGEALAGTRRVAIVGAGFVGLEFASVARAKGLEITVVDAADRVMARAVSPEMSAFFEAMHRSAGVEFLLNDGIRRFSAGLQDKISVELSSGAAVPADIVLSSVGVVPNTELAQAAGLAVDNGIVVDAGFATNDPSIFSIGDCASFPSGGRMLRLESVQNATDHARCLASTLAGRSRSYDAVPWFWSDQGAVKLQIAGLSHGSDERVVAGDPQRAAFSVYCFREGVLVAVESVGQVAEHIAARKALASGAARPSVKEVKADGFGLKAWLQK